MYLIFLFGLRKAGITNVYDLFRTVVISSLRLRFYSYVLKIIIHNERRQIYHLIDVVLILHYFNY